MKELYQILKRIDATEKDFRITGASSGDIFDRRVRYTHINAIKDSNLINNSSNTNLISGINLEGLIRGKPAHKFEAYIRPSYQPSTDQDFLRTNEIMQTLLDYFNWKKNQANTQDEQEPQKTPYF